MISLKLHFGALAPPVSSQIKEQLGHIPDGILRFDSITESLVAVYMEGIITDTENYKARRRLMKKITQQLNKKSKKEIKL